MIVGVDWLNKVQGIIDLKKRQFKFTQENKSYILPITCWEKPQYNNDEPIPINNFNKSNDLNSQTLSSKTNSDEISEDEYESSEDEKEESKGFLVIKNSNENGGDEVNAISSLDTTKIGQVIEESDPKAKYKSFFDTKGKNREGYYYTQGGSERMLIHKMQTRLLEFDASIKKIIA